MSQDVSVSGVKAKVIYDNRVINFVFLFQWKNKNMDPSITGSLIYGMQNKVPSDLLCPTMSHPTLQTKC